MNILFVVNAPEFFLSHRLPVALAAREAGYIVQVATGPGKASEDIENLGFTHHGLPLIRSGTNVWQEIKCVWAIFRLIQRVRPDLIHLVTIKPVLYGGLVARMLSIPVVVAVSGLGSVFVRREGAPSWLRRGVQLIYRLALRHPRLVAIFQNPDDRSVLTKLGAVHEKQAVLIRGSGVALADYPVRLEPGGVPVVTFAARLLKDKGVVEFVEASRLLKQRGLSVRFWLVGAPDVDNPSSVSEHEVAGWVERGLVASLGFRTDVPELFANSNLVVLPSYYGEGLPKVLIEAAACGRAVVTTDQPGCRDAIEPGVTGLLVPPRDAVALADAIQSLLGDPVRRRQMGDAGRVLAKRAFSIEQVVEAHMKIYRTLLSGEVSGG